MQNLKFFLIGIVLNITLLHWEKAFGTCTLFNLLMLITEQPAQRIHCTSSHRLLFWACVKTRSVTLYTSSIRGRDSLVDLIILFILERLHISPADELDALAIAAYNSCLTELESH